MNVNVTRIQLLGGPLDEREINIFNIFKNDIIYFPKSATGTLCTLNDIPAYSEIDGSLFGSAWYWRLDEYRYAYGGETASRMGVDFDGETKRKLMRSGLRPSPKGIRYK